MSAPRFPAPGPRYDSNNETQFRRALAAFLASVQNVAASAASVAWSAVTGKPTTIAGFGLTSDFNSKGDLRWASKKTRSTVTKITASLATTANEQGTVAAKGQLIVITADKACRVRLYASSAARSADFSRARTVDYTAGSGVHAEFIFTGSATIACDPVPFLYNDASNADIYYTIENDALTSQVITVTLTVIPLED